MTKPVRVDLPAGERARLLSLPDGDLAAACEVDFYKASGNGGQKRNKTSSAVRMRHKESGVISKAADSRSQNDNRRTAMQRMRENLALELREEVADSYQAPSEVSQAITRGPYGKNSKTRQKVEYLLLLAEILDVFWQEEAKLSAAAQRLGVSSSALGKLLRGDERVARRMHEMRTAFGLKPLR